MCGREVNILEGAKYDKETDEGDCYWTSKDRFR